MRSLSRYCPEYQKVKANNIKEDKARKKAKSTGVDLYKVHTNRYGRSYVRGQM